MTRLARQMARQAQGYITIAGKQYNILFARLVFRCEVCHGELKRHNHGLVCADNPAHRGFIHQRKVRDGD